MACMKLKTLESYLQNVDGFQNPKVELEQYNTPPGIASCFIHHIQDKFNDIEGKSVADLGSGCGILSIGCALLGAPLTLGFEIDRQAVEIFHSNVAQMEIPSIDCIQCDVLQLRDTKWDNVFDTVVMNPPFGTKNNAGLDMSFAEIGIKFSNSVVYSLHKTATRKFIARKAKEWHVQGEVIGTLKYNIEQTFKFHRKKSVDIEVDLWRMCVSNKDY